MQSKKKKEDKTPKLTDTAISGCQRLEGEEQWGLAANRYSVSFQGDENVLELVVTAAHLCEYSQCVVKRWGVNCISKNM